MNITGEIVLAIFTSGILGTVVSYLLYKRKSNAEINNIDSNSASTTVASALLLVDKYKNEYTTLLEKNKVMEEEMCSLKEQMLKISDGFAISLQELRKENESLRNDNDELKERVRRLEAQVISLGGKPVTHNSRKSDKESGE